MTDKKMSTRRGVILGAAGLAALAWGWQGYLGRDRALTFDPIPDLPGWRVLGTRAVSAASATDAVLIGIGEDAPPPLPADALCGALYARTGPGVPVAVFTDINCPNCRSLEAKLADRQDRITITWIQLPLLGRASETAALVWLAAEHLSGRTSSPPRNIRGLGIAPIIRFHAAQTGVDAELLNDEYPQPAARERLYHHARVAETLGIWGTPAMTIGKTLVVGDVPNATLDALLDMDHTACR